MGSAPDHGAGRGLTKAIRPPSGDHDGSRSFSGSASRGRTTSLASSRSRICEPRLPRPSVKAIRKASGLSEAPSSRLGWFVSRRTGPRPSAGVR